MFASIATGEPLHAPLTISPGAADTSLTVGSNCPTFSWAGSAAAQKYELEVAEMGERGFTEPVLVAELPAGTSTWNLPPGRCLQAGKSYSWTLRSIADGAVSAWSEAAYFDVSIYPDAGDVLLAYEILRRHQAALLGPSRNVPEVAAPDVVAGTPEGVAGPDTGMYVAGRVEALDLDVVQEFVLGTGQIEAEGEIESRNNTAISSQRLTLTTPDSITPLVSLQSRTEGQVRFCVADTGCETGAIGNRASLATERLIVYNGIEVGSAGLTFGSSATASWVGTGGAGFFEVPSATQVTVDDNGSECPSGSIMVGVRLWETDADQIGVQVLCTNP